MAVAAHLLEAIELGLREPVAFEEASVIEKESGIGRQHNVVALHLRKSCGSPTRKSLPGLDLVVSSTLALNAIHDEE